MQESLRTYYRDMFPTQLICNWLTLNGKYELSSRKFAMMPHYKREKIETPEALQEYLDEKCPITFQITPSVGNKRPLFFEVDMDDYYDTIKRTCQCKERECCDTCWQQVARKPLIDCLDFCCNFMEFKHVVPLFSGGRGFWIIINDPEVWLYDTESKTSFAKRVPARIDTGVTIQKNHLMKIPLTPHHRTGILCVPILDPQTFVPSMAPHYAEVGEEHEDLMQEWTSVLE